MRTRKDENLRKPSSFIEAEKSCSKQCPFFSSARHNYIVRNITKQRKTKTNQRWEFKLAFKFEKIAKKKPFLPVCNDIPAFLYLYLRLYFCILDCISVIVFLVFFFVFLSFCHFALCSSSSAAGWPGSGYSQTGPVVKLKQSPLRFFFQIIHLQITIWAKF